MDESGIERRPELQAPLPRRRRGAGEHAGGDEIECDAQRLERRPIDRADQNHASVCPDGAGRRGER